ncbi:MAG: hypothetical protein JWP91_368 [Fibrobacteres bacterium]|nr:hypothetical protein [Fibrobacterota bacterium]
MRKPILLALALMGSLPLLRCTTESEEWKRASLTEPPALPSAATMSIPALDGAAAAKVAGTQSTAAFNVVAARLSVDFWTAVVAVNLAVPVSLFLHAHEAHPVPLPDSSGWQWVVNDGVFSALLTSQEYPGGNVAWKMTITGIGGQPKTWFTGISSGDGRTGDWTFLDPDAGTARYGFSYDLTGADQSVKASVADKGQAGFGSYLQWKSDGTRLSFERFDAARKDAIRITYDPSTGAGRFQDVDGGVSRCWDTKANGFFDVDCSKLGW